jgi:hypothetical protein
MQNSASSLCMIENKFISHLPRDLVLYIYGFIPIDTKLHILHSKYTLPKLIHFSNSLHIDYAIHLFTRFIKNKLVCHSGLNRFDSYYLHPELSNMLPKIQFTSWGSRTPTIVHHRFEPMLVDAISLRYMPQKQPTWSPKLETYQRANINDAITKMCALSTLNCIYKDFQYIIKKVWFTYLIALIKYGQPEYEKKLCISSHVILKKHMKKHVFKELHKQCVLYDKRVKQRLKQEKSNQKMLNKLEKSKHTLFEKSPSNIVIIRKKKKIVSNQI